MKQRAECLLHMAAAPKNFSSSCFQESMAPGGVLQLWKAQDCQLLCRMCERVSEENTWGENSPADIRWVKTLCRQMQLPRFRAHWYLQYLCIPVVKKNKPWAGICDWGHCLEWPWDHPLQTLGASQTFPCPLWFRVLNWVQCMEMTDRSPAHHNDSEKNTSLVQGSGVREQGKAVVKGRRQSPGQLLHSWGRKVLTCQPVWSSGFQSGCGCLWSACTRSSCQHGEELQVSWGNRDAYSVSHDSESRAHTPNSLALMDSSQEWRVTGMRHSESLTKEVGARAENLEVPPDSDAIPNLFSRVCTHIRKHAALESKT